MQIILLLLVACFIMLPGIAFRLGYLKRDGLQILTETKLYIEILFIIFISLTLHLIAWYFAEHFEWYDFNVDLLYSVLIGNQDLVLEHEEIAIANFVKYNFGVAGAVFVVGLITNIVFDSLEIKFPQNLQFLDYTGNWDRILSHNREEKRKSVNTIVDVLVQLDSEKIIYTGILKEYYIDSKGYIDKLILNKVVRIKLEDYDEFLSTQPNKTPFTDESKESLLELVALQKTQSRWDNRFFEVITHHFVIYGSTIKNISIRYEKIVSGKNRVYKTRRSLKLGNYLFRMQGVLTHKNNGRFLPLYGYKRKHQGQKYTLGTHFYVHKKRDSKVRDKFKN